MVSQKLIEGDRQLSKAPAGRVEHGVGDGGGHTYYPDLADPLDPHCIEAIRLTDENDVETGNIRVDRNQVVAERRVGNAARGVEDGLLEQCHAYAHHDGTHDLTARQLLIEDASTIHCGHHAGDAQQPEIGVDVDLRELRGERRRWCEAGALGMWRHVTVGAQLLERVGEVPRGRPLAIICSSGYRSSVAASVLELAASL